MAVDLAARKAQRDALKNEFYSLFDQSKAERWLAMTDAELGARGQLLGTGTHFTAWRFGELVFKRALATTFAKKGAPTLREWVAALERAKGVGGLMPPFESLGNALVMPYGNQPLASAAPVWQPVAATVKMFEADLERAGLVLDDVVQARCRKGVPFLVDLSDLRMKDGGMGSVP